MARSSPGARLWASPTTGRAALSAAALILASAPAAADLAHHAEIEAFASTMAIARTVRESCPGIEPDESYLEALRQRLRITEADHSAFAPAARAMAEALKRGFAEAPSRLAWCDAVYRLYGRKGSSSAGCCGASLRRRRQALASP